MDAWQAWGQVQARRGRYYAGRLLRRPFRPWQSTAVERVVLSPQETLPCAPLRMPVEHAQRVRGGFEGEPIAPLIEQLTRTTWTHAATEAFVLENAALVGHKLFTGDSNIDLFSGAAPRMRDVEAFDHVVLASTYAGTRWFGHFIHDDLPLQMLAATLGTAVSQARVPFDDEPPYRALFGIAAPRALPGWFARRCSVVVDHGQNAGKRARFEQMRQRVPRAAGPATRVYLRRTGGMRRVLHGEDRLLEELSRRGFTVLAHGEDPVERFIDVCSRAEQIVSVDGSHIAPALLIAPRGCEIVNVMPPERVSLVILDVARSAGLRAAVYIGERGGDEISVDVDDLLRFIEAS